MSKDNSFDTETLQKIANLSVLSLPEKVEEQDKLANSFAEIANLFGKLASVNLKNVEPLTHPLEIFQPLRLDIPEAKADPKELQKLATKSADSVYLVPKVIE